MKTLKCDGCMGRARWMLLAALIATVLAPGGASGQKLKTLLDFNSSDGAQPVSSLLEGSNGDLFGTTLAGGGFGNGVVFEITKTNNGFSSTATVLYNCEDVHGSNPAAAVIADAQGNLFGTAVFGGASGVGTVFEIIKTSTGYSSTPVVLAEFDNVHGAAPFGGLIADVQENLFGTTSGGGDFGRGVVFEIPKTVNGYSGTPTVLVSFDGANGADPQGALLADVNGDLFGTTTSGGDFDAGTVFEITKTASGYASTPTVLFSFDFAHGAYPVASLIADIQGNLLGTTSGGGAVGNGVVFQIPKTANGYASTPNILVDFDGTNGATPTGALLADANGNLFATTAGGGSFGKGTVFKINNTGGSYANTPTVLINFDGTNGATPSAALIVKPDGRVLGTAEAGGKHGFGTVFEISHSGF